ncbi:MAG: hypothetical protein Q7S11_04700, partial [bacterium]|nr:hypothetical protein [bacterium]
MKQLFISNADFVLPLNGIDYLLRHFFLWSDNTSALSLDGILRLFSKSETLLFFWLTNSALLTGYFYIAFVLIFCGISIYTFLKRFLNVPKYPAMVGALVFLINPAFLGNYSKIGLILSASALPLALVCLKSFLATQRFKYLIYIILLLNLSLLHPFTFIVNTFVLVVYVVYHYKKVLNYQGIVRIFTAGLLFLLLSLYFVLPLISLGTVSKDSIQNTFTRGGEAVDYTQIVDVASAGGYVNGLALSKDVFLDFDFYSDKSQAIFYFSNYLLLIFIVSFFLF